MRPPLRDGDLFSALPRPDPLFFPPPELLLTVAQAGEYLGTGERFIRRLITERRINFVKIGKYVRLERSTLEALVDAGRVPSQRR